MPEFIQKSFASKGRLHQLGKFLHQLGKLWVGLGDEKDPTRYIRMQASGKQSTMTFSDDTSTCPHGGETQPRLSLL